MPNPSRIWKVLLSFGIVVLAVGLFFLMFIVIVFMLPEIPAFSTCHPPTCIATYYLISTNVWEFFALYLSIVLVGTSLVLLSTTYRRKIVLDTNEIYSENVKRLDNLILSLATLVLLLAVAGEILVPVVLSYFGILFNTSFEGQLLPYDILLSAVEWAAVAGLVFVMSRGRLISAIEKI